MKNNQYWILGTVSIPDDKKDEMNEYVMKLLDKCGIRKTTERIIAGKPITVLEKPMPDKDGIIRFDYSIFEKTIREEASYNSVTCELTVPDQGYNEFAISMKLIWVLTESYSQENCYIMYEDETISIKSYAKVLHSLLGKEFIFENRSKPWDMTLMLHNDERTKDPGLDHLLFACNSYLCRSQLLAVGYAIIEPDIAPQPSVSSINELNEDSRMSEIGYYLNQVLQKMLDKDKSDGVENFIKKLSKMPLPERQKLSKERSDRGDLAKISLFMLPPIIVSYYAVLTEEDFWTCWDRLNITGYTDVIEAPLDTTPAEQENELYFHEAIMRENEDEFLEFWDGTNLTLSDDLLRNMNEWKTKFNLSPDIPEDKVEEKLLSTINTLYDQWNCRFADNAFIDEILSHKSDPSHRKALTFFQGLLEDESIKFPELTKTQAMEWVISRYITKEERIITMACQSLLINQKQRAEILCF